MILLVSQSLCPVTATNAEYDGGFAKQSRLFNKIGNEWPMDAAEDDTSFNDAEARVNPGLKLLEELIKLRQRYAKKFSNRIHCKM